MLFIVQRKKNVYTHSCHSKSMYYFMLFFITNTLYVIVIFIVHSLKKDTKCALGHKKCILVPQRYILLPTVYKSVPKQDILVFLKGISCRICIPFSESVQKGLKSSRFFKDFLGVHT